MSEWSVDLSVSLRKERSVDLSLSTSMRVNERRESSRKLLNELGDRFYIVS